MTQEELSQAQGLIEEAISVVGEEEFADLVEAIAGEKLRTAVGRLQSSEWWEETLQDCLMNPTKYNNVILAKLLDKAVPSQQAVRVGADEGFRLIIQTEAEEK